VLLEYFTEPQKFHCQLCQEWHCVSCQIEVDRESFLPIALQLNSNEEKFLVCRQAIEMQQKFGFIKLDSRNPLLKIESYAGLRQVLRLRRSVHILFDCIKCDEILQPLFEQRPSKHPLVSILTKNQIYLLRDTIIPISIKFNELK
jgi:hypothetical protein